jgi:hypothetical protein
MKIGPAHNPLWSQGHNDNFGLANLSPTWALSQSRSHSEPLALSKVWATILGAQLGRSLSPQNINYRTTSDGCA